MLRILDFEFWVTESRGELDCFDDDLGEKFFEDAEELLSAARLQ
jgi:hypothetical protein